MNWKEAIRALLSGVLLAISFAPWGPVIAHGQWAILAWIAWLPLLDCLLPINPQQRCEHPFRLGFLMGLAFWLGTVFWLGHVSIAGMTALVFYLSIFIGAWSAAMSRVHARWPAVTGPVHVLIAFFGASAWVALEWLRGCVLSGFPWNFAAATQHQNLVLIQIAELTGSYGVSFVLIFFNLSLWLTWRRLKTERFSARNWRYEFSLAILLVAFCLMFGMRRLLAERKNEGAALSLKLALIQPDVAQEVKYEAVSFSEQKDRLRQLTLAAAATKPDLIIWPETALVMGPTFNPESRLWLETLVNTTKIPILFGTLDAAPPSMGGNAMTDTMEYFNAAMLMGMNGELATPYHKMHLVPFGEFVPFEKWLPWMRFLTPIQGSFGHGQDTLCFDFKGARLGPLICFEDTFPWLARNLSRNGADILVNLTNDAWFKDSPGAAMHMANAVFRAIENRRPLVRCANSGVTCVIDPMGRIQQHKPFIQGFLLIKVTFQRNVRNTFYSQYGDWFAFLCGLVSGMTLLICLWRRPLPECST